MTFWKVIYGNGSYSDLSDSHEFVTEKEANDFYTQSKEGYEEDDDGEGHYLLLCRVDLVGGEFKSIQIREFTQSYGECSENVY
tara:strand:- start:92 stop:340 length:249 start_codon:yes stop_codon:yes gene_type:complete